MVRMLSFLPGIAALAIAAAAAAATPGFGDTPEVAKAKYLWSQSPHGKMLERILPPSIDIAQLPEPRSEGARLAARYCVQCHYLPNPQMHAAAKWRLIVDRMVWRMRGHGNLGEVMKEMMAEVKAPTDAEVVSLARYLERHGQAELDPAHPGLKSEAGQIYSIACSQCHALPDPRRHTALDWPQVVDRMKGHMAWTNTIVGARELRTIPELKTAEIVRFLQRYAKSDRPPHR
jgi:cytochrome c5